MKIFNNQPIRVSEYFLDKSYIHDESGDILYEPYFTFGHKNIESLNTVLVCFEMKYHVGIYDSLLLKFESYSQFNFVPENVADDLISVENYLNDYYSHTENFINTYGYKSMREIEAGHDRKLKYNAIVLLQMLQFNGEYPFDVLSHPYNDLGS